jgi:hypothetical protein
MLYSIESYSKLLYNNFREFLPLARALGGWGKGKKINNRRQKKSFRPREGAAGGRGEGEESRRARALGWEAARPCVSKETKLAKIDSLIEKDFCARRLKDLSIFAGFVSASGGASRGADLARGARQLV